MAKPVLTVPKKVQVAPRSSAVSPRPKPRAPRPGEIGYRGASAGMGTVAQVNQYLNTNTQYKPSPNMGTTDAVRNYLSQNPQWDNGTLGAKLDAFDERQKPAPAPIGAPSGGGVKVDFANADGSPIGAPVVSYDPGVQARYDASMGAADLQYKNATSGLAGERVGALARYGYSATGYDGKTGEGTGTSSDTWTVNTDNPFSVAAMAKRAYDQRTSGNQIQYANRGQLYSGALKNQQDATTFGYGQQDDAARKGLSAALSSLIARKLGADNSRKAAYTDAAATRKEDQLKIAREQLNGR